MLRGMLCLQGTRSLWQRLLRGGGGSKAGVV